MTFRRALCLATGLLLAAAAAAADAPHPFAKPLDPIAATPGLNLERLEWGPTTLAYSAAWSGGASASQGFLLQELRSVLAPGLTFRARFGLAFTPGAQLSGREGPASFTLPEASLTWRPSEHVTLRLEYQQLGAASPYGWTWRAWDQPWYLRDNPAATLPEEAETTPADAD
ncbi:MAG: hypothetical protein JW819_07325 [Candidatus Krumholzibacteriota bacterium]|nr:hypothetical protein [Candidatus Krumholzibacteriota bacterium]